jgi:high affinity Mn2+ porin
MILVAWVAPAAWAESAAPAELPAELPVAQRFALHLQATYVEQEDGSFRAPYAGANSLTADTGRETTDLTLYLGARVAPGAELWIDPEIDEGFGLDNTVGVAGFPSAEAYKVGRYPPYLRLPRAFFRETVNLGAVTEAVEPDQNQLGGARSPERLVLTAGKFGVPDIFDTSQYAHDPRHDFLNWTAVDAGTFDYAADAWGFTVGAALEWYRGDWTLRGGWFDLSDIPNSTHLDPGGHEFQLDAELEHRHVFKGEPGRLALTFYDSRGRMARLADALALAAASDQPIDLAAVRRYRSRVGLSLVLDQQVSEALGVFARLGKAGGNVEAYEFTDVDRSAEVGVSIQGSLWRRPDDRVGLAALVNGISAERQRYLDAGGLGILVGDGKLPHPGTEQILETYYSIVVWKPASLSFDYQFVNHPGYNADRGPVSVFAVRLHLQF